MKTALDLKADILKALAHPNRIRILEALRNGEICNCELAPVLGLEQSNLSRHLMVLTQAGLVMPRKVGVRTFYRVVDDEVFEVLHSVQGMVRRRVEQQMTVISA